MTYNQRNREVILNRAKDCYENDKERLRESKQEMNIETCLKKVRIKEKNMEKADVIICLTKRNKN